MRFVLIFMLALVSVSCTQNNVYEHELATMDRMQNMIDTTLAAMEAIDTATYGKREVHLRENIRILIGIFTQNSDTIYREQALLLSNYRNSWMPAEMLFPAWEAARHDLIFTKTQLISLEHGISHNLLDERAVKESYRMELSATEKAIANAKNLLMLFDVEQQPDPATAARVDSVIALAKSHV